MHVCEAYALDVVAGRRVAGKPEIQACQRHLDDLVRQADPAYPWMFDESKADKIYRWFSYCKHVEGPLAGQPIELMPFQQFDLGCIFGWVSKESGYRRFKKAYIQEARKNGKTATLAAVTLFMMVGDGEESPAVYCAAVDKKQARIMYRAAWSMALKSPDIRKRLRIHRAQISHITRGGELEAFSRETKNKDGFSPSLYVLDEFHAHPTSEIYDLLSSAKGQRAQPLGFVITTAGTNVESPCHKEYEYCKHILAEPSLNDRYFVSIREMDEGDDEHNPLNWGKSNPLRVAMTLSMEELREQHNEAFGSGDPEKIRTFRVKNLNQWVQGTEDNFMSHYMDKWNDIALERADFLALTRGMLCNVGVDLSKKIDLTAVGLVFALDQNRIGVCAHGFIPQEAVERHKKTDKIPYDMWAKAGWLTITPGNVTDFSKVQAYIQDVELEYGWRVHELGYDPYAATHFATEMMQDGYTCIEIRQGMKTLSEPTKLFRELVASGQLVHDGSPLLRWCVANAMQVTDKQENLMLSKKNAGDTKRIDLLAAIIDAVVRIQSLRGAQDFDAYVKSDGYSF